MKTINIVLLACFISIASFSNLHPNSQKDIKTNQLVNFNIKKVLIVTPNVWYASLSYNGLPALLKTTNGGTNWTLFSNIFNGLNTTNVINDFCFPDSVTGYACGGSMSSSWIAKTTDGGYTWDTVNSASSNEKTSIWFMTPNTGMVGGAQNYSYPEQNKVYATNDGGLTWTSTMAGSAWFERTVTFITNSDNQSFFANVQYFPIINKNNYGTPGWETVVNLNPTEYGTITDLKFLNANTGIFLCPKIDGGTLFGITSNGFVSTSTTDFNNYELAQPRFSGNNIFCLKIERNNHRLFKSTNLGLNWSLQNYDVPITGDAYPYLMDVKDNLFFVGNYSGDTANSMMRSTNYGVNWAYMGMPLPTSVITGTVRYSDNNQIVISGMVKAFIYEYPSGEIVYVDSTQISNVGEYTLRNVHGDSVYIGVYPNSTPVRDYVVSYYSETTYWTHAAPVRPNGRMRDVNIRVQRMEYTNSNNSISGRVVKIDKAYGWLKDAVIYAKNGNTYVGCAISDVDGVYHLRSLPAGNLNVRIDRFGYTLDSTNVTVTSTSNIDSLNFVLDKIIIGIREIGNTLPLNYLLKQNYPNPFNPSTSIEFSIPKSGIVKLTVYDMLGREIKTALNEFKRAGNYAVDFRADALASGVYFYKLAVNDFVQVKRMLLIK